MDRSAAELLDWGPRSPRSRNFSLMDDADNGSLDEYFLREGGSPLVAGGELSLGLAYNETVFGAANGDLQFAYGVAGGPQLTGSVIYVVGGAGVLGDYNGNGVVDGPDLGVWRGTFCTNVTVGFGADGTGDGRIDGADFLFWQRRLAATSTTVVMQPSPEPQSFVLAGVGLGCLGAARRRLH